MCGSISHMCVEGGALSCSRLPPVWTYVLPWGLENQAISRRSCQVICRFSSTTIASIAAGPSVYRRTSLAAPFGACVPHLDIVIACARSPLQDLVSSSENSSGRPIITFPHWRALSFVHMTTNRTSQPHFSGDQINPICVFDVLDCTALPSHPYPDCYCPQRLSPTSL
jgi:hypothetical protein